MLQLNAALRRLDAQYVMGTPLPAGDGGEANFQVGSHRLYMIMVYTMTWHDTVFSWCSIQQ